MIVSKEKFYDMLSKHDWYYQMSDDNQYFLAGAKSESEIYHVIKEHPELVPMFKAFYDHMFNGPAWGTELKPKPKLEDF